MTTKRKSYHLSELKEDLRKRALKEKDEEKRTDYWRMYYKAQHAEHEVREMVMDTEIRHLLEIHIAYGMLPDDWKEQIANIVAKIEADKNKQPPLIEDIDDDDIPPRQLGFWDE
jgi:hypothetical protein